MAVDTTALAICITFPILAILAVIGRLYARHMKNTLFGLDDGLVLAALVLSIGNAAMVLYGAIKTHLGQHMPLTPEGLAELGPAFIVLEQISLASELMVTLAIGLARWAILIFYSQLFDVKSFKVPIWIMYSLNGIWLVGFWITYLTQCIPLDHLWDQPQGDRTGCVSGPYERVYAVSSIILDVLVLCMPWPMVLRLQMPMRQKLAVLGILMLGAVVVAISIGKCWTFFNISAIIASNHDVTYDEGPLFYWTVPECCLSVVCVCLPTMRPIFHGMSPESVIGSLRSAFSLPSFQSSRNRTGSAESVSRNNNSVMQGSYEANDKASENNTTNTSGNRSGEHVGVVGLENDGAKYTTSARHVALQDLEHGDDKNIRVEQSFYVR